MDGVITERLADFISLVPFLSSQGGPWLGISPRQTHLQLATEYFQNPNGPDGYRRRKILLPAPHFSTFSEAHHEYKTHLFASTLP